MQILSLLCRICAISFIFFASSAAKATMVVPPAFEELVGRADYVVHSVVKSVRCEWKSDGANRHIMTKVELEVKEVIAGNPPNPLVLEMLGGEIDGIRLVVHGVPEFKAGDEDILFVHGNGVQFSPLVALSHGRYPIKRDPKTGLSFVTRANGEPLVDERDVVLPLMSTGTHSASAVAPPALTFSTFVGKIKTSRHAHPSPTVEN